MTALPPLRAIRKRCVDCSCYVLKGVRDCWKKDYPLYPLRMGKSVKGKSRMKAIRKFCLYCGGNSAYEVRLCPTTNCTLYEYRFGKNPSLTGKRSRNIVSCSKSRVDKGV